jgi:hypothetical protein
VLKREYDIPENVRPIVTFTDAVADRRHGIGGDSVLVGGTAGGRDSIAAATIGFALRQGKGLLDFFRRPQRFGIEFDDLRRHGDAPALDLLGAGIIHGTGDAIRLRRIPGVVVTINDRPDPLAKPLADFCADTLPEKQPELKIAGRGGDRHAHAHVRGPAHLLIGIAIDNQREHRGSIFELAAAVPPRRIFSDSAALEVNIMAGIRIRDCGIDHGLHIADREAARDQGFGCRMQP